jgi:hypothetical protein
MSRLTRIRSALNGVVGASVLLSPLILAFGHLARVNVLEGYAALAAAWRGRGDLVRHPSVEAEARRARPRRRGNLPRVPRPRAT